MNSNSGYNRLFDPMAETGQPLDFAQHGLGQRTVGNPFSEKAKMSVRNLNVYYDDKQAIHDVSLDINRNEVMAMIGPSGCGKSTFLRCLNRMNDTIDNCKVEGEVTLDEKNIYHRKQDVVPLRARVGIVFQKPNPFPKIGRASCRERV